MNPVLKRRACESCRHLKVHCERDESSPTTPCKRCAKAKRQCIVTTPSRERSKKPASRVAELERKIEALTASLHREKTQVGSDPTVDHTNPHEQVELSQGLGEHHEHWRQPQTSRVISDLLNSSSALPQGGAGNKRKFDTSNRYSPSPSESGFQGLEDAMNEVYERSATIHQALGYAEYIDVIDRNVIDSSTATRIFNRYKIEMSEHLPVVRFPPTTTATDVRRTKPFLFLAILAVACSTIKPEIQSSLVTEVYETIAIRIICRGEKSLELVQTLQVITLWYQPTNRFEELNFNQLLHIAVVMAIDIGLGKRQKTTKPTIWRDRMLDKTNLPDPNVPETRRAWMGCYFGCTA
jgi:Fungal specific transcription factor domain